jgi:hypothetical protein
MFNGWSRYVKNAECGMTAIRRPGIIGQSAIPDKLAGC